MERRTFLKHTSALAAGIPLAARGATMKSTYDPAEWTAEPSAETTRSHEMVKAFIARQLSA
jgi:hypothetical protein